jgi:AcrR family transcriptional regulator
MARTIKKSPRMTAQDRRRQILEVALRMVAEHGFHEVSIEAVAQRAGISRPVVYEHFGDLAGLLEAVVAQVGERALTQLAAVMPTGAGSGDPRDRLLAAFRGYLEAARSDPATWRLVLMPPEGAPEMLRGVIAVGRSAVVAQLAETVRGGLGSGERSPDPELTASMLSWLADESARLMLTQPEEYPVDRILGHARWLLDQFAPRQGAAGGTALGSASQDD